MNLARLWLPYFGSSRISRFAATRRLGMISPQTVFRLARDVGLRPLPDLTLIDSKKWMSANDRLLRTLGTVFRTTLVTAFNARSIQRAANGVVTNTWQVFYTAATNQDNAVLLQVVAFTTDVRGNLETVGQTHTAYFTQCRVRFFRRGGVHTG